MGRGLLNICRTGNLTGKELAKYVFYIIDTYMVVEGESGIDSLDIVWTGELDRPVLELTASPEAVAAQLKKENMDFPGIPSEYISLLKERAKSKKINFFSSYDEYYKKHALYETARVEFKNSGLLDAHVANTIGSHVKKFLTDHRGLVADKVSEAHKAYAQDEAETLWLASLSGFREVTKLFHTHDFTANELMHNTFHKIKARKKQDGEKFDLQTVSARSVKRHLGSPVVQSQLEQDFKAWLLSENPEKTATNLAGVSATKQTSSSSSSSTSSSPVGSPEKTTSVDSSLTNSTSSSASSSSSSSSSSSPREDESFGVGRRERARSFEKTNPQESAGKKLEYHSDSEVPAKCYRSSEPTTTTNSSSSTETLRLLTTKKGANDKKSSISVITATATNTDTVSIAQYKKVFSAAFLDAPDGADFAKKLMRASVVEPKVVTLFFEGAKAMLQSQPLDSDNKTTPQLQPGGAAKSN